MNLKKKNLCLLFSPRFFLSLMTVTIKTDLKHVLKIDIFVYSCSFYLCDLMFRFIDEIITFSEKQRKESNR